MKNILFLLLFTTGIVRSNTIDYVGGNISYQYIAGGCPSAIFEITVNIFTKQSAARDSIFIYFGDGTYEYIQRYTSLNSKNSITHTIYKTMHNYSCGTFNVYYEDTLNIPNAKNTTQNGQSIFFLSSDIVLNGFYPHNNSYIQFNSPATNVFKNQNFNFNSITSTSNILKFDSVIYSLVPANLLSSYGLYIPSGAKINRTSGEIIWPNPDTLGSYAFIINSVMYKYGNSIGSSFHYYKFDVINQNPSFIYDSISKVPVNVSGYKEISYSANNTYSFSTVYTDLNADSIKLITYPIDFFTTSPVITVTKDNLKKNSLSFSWSPIAADVRVYPYNFVLNAISHYPNDSVVNSYQTVSFINSNIIGVNEITLINSIRVHPNPTNSTLTITDKQNQFQNSRIEIKNTLGQTVLSLPFKPEIDVSFLSTGLYFLQITTEDKQSLNAKFIKQ